MNNISQLIDRATTLATQSATGTFTGDRGVSKQRISERAREIDRQAQSIGSGHERDFAKSLSVFMGAVRPAAP